MANISTFSVGETVQYMQTIRRGRSIEFQTCKGKIEVFNNSGNCALVKPLPRRKSLWIRVRDLRKHDQPASVNAVWQGTSNTRLRNVIYYPIQMKNKYTYHNDSDGDGPWISFPNNGGEVGDLADVTEELNRLRDALLGCISAIDDEETFGGIRLNLRSARVKARKAIGQRNTEIVP